MGIMRSFFLLCFSLFILSSIIASARPMMGGEEIGESAAESDSDLVVSEAQILEWKKLDGLSVHEITVDGLVRTRLTALHWLMHTKKDSPFSSAVFARDLQVLFNTGNLYDLSGDVERDEGGGVHLVIRLKDKWTLFPVFGGQQGGGSSTFGGGVFDSNLLGYMVNSSVLFWSFNGATSYDINANQEYFAGTDNMWSLDWQDNIEAQTVHLYNGSSAGQFAWRRQQKEVMLGTHLNGPWRILGYASVFQDSLFNNDGNFNVHIPYAGLQQRIYPKFIYGKVNWNNYQEEGFEIAAQTTIANFVGGGPQYAALELDYKQVWKTGTRDRDNTAFNFSTSHMTSSGPNFLYQVGGYYNIRGFSDMREFGRDNAFANLEWRPYLFRHRWQFLDLDLMVVQACLFTDAGSAWGDSSLTGEASAANFHLLWSAGAGLRVNMVRFAGAILRLDWAQTLSPNEGVGFSLGVGQFF
jgi:outer membrane protein assembly factor BamA